MTVANIKDIKNISDFTIAVKDKSGEIKYITVQEGSGDNLTAEDIQQGCIDYINYTEYTIDNSVIKEHDGGMELLTEYYADMSPEDIIKTMLYATDTPDDVTIFCLPCEADTEFFENATGLDMNDPDSTDNNDELLDVFNQIIQFMSAN